MIHAFLEEEKQFSSLPFTIDAERGTGVSKSLSCI